MARLEEKLQWVPAITPPDEGMIVLVATPSPGEPVWPGYLEDGIWRFADGNSTGYEVTHWAEMPAGPARASAPQGDVSFSSAKQDAAQFDKRGLAPR
ncbi:MAG: hypothetical protein ACOVQU_07085 [Exiguobacterium acetylicum]